MRYIYIILVLFNSLFGFSQTISYNFTAVSSAFTSNATPTILHAASVDDVLSAATNIGFTFQYGCQNYTQFKASSNGWLTFNTAVTGGTAFNNLNTSTDRPIIAPLWDDLKTGTGGNVNYKLTGVTPNRILTVEWKEMLWTFSGTTQALSFQVKLYETSNIIEFVYTRNGAATANITTSAGASIGLSGIPSGNFYSLQDVTATPAVSSVTEVTNIATKPATGQIYRWDPILCSGVPAAGTGVASPSVNCSNFTTTLSLTGGATGCGLTYLWYEANATGGPYTAIGTATSVSTNTFAVVNGTPKFFKCVTTCGASSATTAVISAAVSLDGAGVGSYSVSLPYSITGQTTCGFINDIKATGTGSVTNVCGSTSYYTGEDVVYVFTPTVTAAFNGSVTSTGTWVGMMLYEGCPTGTGVCVANSQSSAGNQSITSCTNVLTAGNTYYLIIDSYASPTCNPYDLDISLSSCTGMPTSGIAVASPSANCGPFTTTLSLSGNSSSCGISYQWYHSNASAGTYTAIGIASSITTQTFAVSTTKYFKCVVTCGASSATTAVISTTISPLSAGAGTYSVSLPYSITGQTTCGFVNDITSTKVTNICGSSSYYTGEDVVYVFTPTVTATFDGTVTSTGTFVGMMLYEGCPTSTGVCVANSQSSSGTQSITATSGCSSGTLTAGLTYYLIIDSYAAPACNPYDLNMSIIPITSSTTTPCNMAYTPASTTYSFETFTGTILPTTDDVLFSTYINFGFSICFDGKPYTGGYVASNSAFVFDAVPCFPNISSATYAAGGVSTGYSITGAAPINGTSVPRNAILAPWQDIHPNSTQTVSTSRTQYTITGTSPNRKVIISWENIPMYSASCASITASRASSQIKLFEFDSSIEIHIKNKQVCASWNGGDAILGLHNYNGTTYIPPVAGDLVNYNFPTNWSMTNSGYKFTTSCNGSGSSCATVLPIGFSDFYGDKIDNVNTLYWKTTEEENMDYFVIERSIDAINFTDIGKVTANNKASTYIYKDAESVSGMINYYRIRAVENSEKTSSTNIISIGASENEILTVWPIFPNPANTSEIFFRLDSKKTGLANFVLYDVLGNIVSNSEKAIETGVKVYDLNISSLSLGVYFVEVKNSFNEIISKQKLIINK